MLTLSQQRGKLALNLSLTLTALKHSKLPFSAVKMSVVSSIHCISIRAGVLRATNYIITSYSTSKNTATVSINLINESAWNI